VGAGDQTQGRNVGDEASATFVDLAAIAQRARPEWTVHPIADLHDVHAGLAVIEGTYFAHNHTTDPELFVVLEGRLLVHMDEGTQELLPHQALVVPPGTTHLSEAPERTVVLNVKGGRGDTVEAALRIKPTTPKGLDGSPHPER
jgi:mannose-6-phosphate isomerase-like protein (cupin superfamily)